MTENTSKAGRIVFDAASDWWQIVNKNGEIEIDEFFPDGWEKAAEIAGIDTDDEESWVATVIEVAERHSALKVGDFACCQGTGSDVVFVRPKS